MGAAAGDAGFHAFVVTEGGTVQTAPCRVPRVVVRRWAGIIPLSHADAQCIAAILASTSDFTRPKSSLSRWKRWKRSAITPSWLR